MINLSKAAIILVVNIVVFFTIGQNEVVYADDNINQQCIYELSTATGEKLIPLPHQPSL